MSGRDSAHRDAAAAPRVDVLVIGGGPAGAATSVALARRGRSVTLVARPPGRGPRLGETVPAGIVTTLARLGLWRAFLADGHLPSAGTVACWGGLTPFERDALFDPYGCGWHLDRARFEATLLATAEDAGVDVRAGTVRDCTPDGDGWTVRVTGPLPATVRAGWVADASGRAARVARTRGAGRLRCDRLVGLARFARTPDGGEDTDTRTVVEATEAGWWYVAPLPGGRAVAVLFTDADLLPRDPGGRTRCWTDLLATTRLARDRLGGASDLSPLRAAPADSGVLAPPCGRRWVAVGDAAQTWDPLSGRGIATAMASAPAAAEVLVARHPDTVALDCYARQVRDVFGAYLRERAVQYGRERRWVHSPFWQRRAGVLRLGAPPRSTGRTGPSARSSTAGAEGAA
ncbi:NAD(P)/FAD-dependent oxidoreductase [Geodermatophilus sp. YIM 151500]|uniref:NAD(P)/FAD-dependent oxidoreductase n=1 Tax=Geodermatophilus sp. YIM 151500 TaxID=2984531 RepID=UPI0021E420C4|nr:NAD(P)/FAD-dependent oxidoreductase [Geodermatophilus sp. YIM 151500]MCV2489177.1 NAD(P)/FAD-dependent oxidoreductase [Geodermatophilus sp. YIM 151500]